DIEVFMSYGMCFKSLGEWYVQLLAESLGKRHDREGATVHYGRTPIAAVGSTDMHAQTQQHQDGKRNKVIQFLQVDEFEKDVVLGNPFPHLEDFAKYDGVSLNKALQIALLANREALDKDNRFSALYRLPAINEFYIGQIFYFLMLSIAYEGELANVDAYDQPGVEAYKKIIKRELGR
ncbi:MAG: glucose-6-phosphate isomerase, partial [Phascolarctobacterium sp.]|nr:glucose-6-phosphate isomerase [Phascolarctobacterium sp.]